MMHRISIWQFLFLVFLFFIPRVSTAQTAAPRTVNFQGVLVDDGGNVLHDLQETDLELSIIDGTGAVLYTEIQHVPVIHSAVSVLVGRGTAEGIPYDAFDPTTTKLLRVKLVDQSVPQEVLELASVPYAIYAQTLAAPIGSDLILDESITQADLSADLVTLLENNLTTDLDVHRTERDAHHASNIDLDNVFVNAGGNNVQDVLQGIDNAISIRVNQDTELAGDIEDEATARADADTAHAATAIATAHPNGFLPIGRLDTDVATQGELDTHAATTTGIHGVGTGKIVGTTLEQTLTNKTLTSPTLSDDIIKRDNGDQWTLPNAGDQTFVGASASQTLTNKTLEATTMTGDLTMSSSSVAMTDPSGCVPGGSGTCNKVDGVDVSDLASKLPSLGPGENLDSRYVNTTGDDAMAGNLDMDTANITMDSGYTVDGVDISTHDHSGSGKGGSLYGVAIWSTSGEADDEDYVGRVPSGMEDVFSSCGIAFGVAAFDIADGVDRLCLKACRNNRNKNFRIRCVVASSDNGGDGYTVCGDWFSDSSILGNDDPNNDGDTTDGDCDYNNTHESCRVSYRVQCVRNS